MSAIDTESRLDVRIPAARAFVHTLNILIKYVRMYGFHHKRTETKFNDAWQELLDRWVADGDCSFSNTGSPKPIRGFTPGPLPAMTRNVLRLASEGSTAVTVLLVVVKVAVVAPAATVTEVATVAAVVLLLVSVTTVPPVGAAPFRVMVPVLFAPPVTAVGLRDTEDSATGFTVSVAVLLRPP